MKIKYSIEETTTTTKEKETTLLDILNWKEDEDREKIVMIKENYTLRIFFWSILKSVQVLNWDKDQVFSIDTNRGISNETIIATVENLIKELEAQGEQDA